MEKVHDKELFFGSGIEFEDSRNRWKCEHNVYVDENAIERSDGEGEKND